MSEEPTSPSGKPPLRVISTAWGTSYVGEFLDFCLPALIAPGNIPALTEHFTVELVFMTGSRDFEKVRAHEAFKQASRVCATRLVDVDDLAAVPKMHYGMSLTYALYRGFQDLGPELTDTYLLFANSDFILADGSYRNMLPYLLRGDRLIYAPSYCVLEGPVRMLLNAERRAGDPALAVPPRKMADWILRYPHYTLRSKTVNRPFFGAEGFDHFYWQVDESTLLVRQYPVALVAMKPERHLADVGTYWDYGIPAEFCPSLKGAALADSDEYLMLELRDHQRARNAISIGWPTQEQIAGRMVGFATDYTRHAGKMMFALHSKDLPPGTDAARTELDRYVEGVEAHLPAALPSHENHPQWTYHYPLFHEARRKFFAQAGQFGGPGAAAQALKSGPQALAVIGRQELDRATKAIENIAGMDYDERSVVHIERLLRATNEFVGQMGDLKNEVEVLEGEFSGPLAAHVRAKVLAQSRGLPAPAETDALEGRLNVMRVAMEQFEASLEKLENEVSIILDDTSSRRFEFIRLQLGIQRAAAILRDRSTPGAREAGPDDVPTKGFSGRARALLRLLFGAAPAFRPWHTLHSCTRLAFGSAAPIVRGKRVLWLGRPELRLLASLSPQAETFFNVPLEMALLPDVLAGYLEGQAPFDSCILECQLTDLVVLKAAYDASRPFLKPGGKLLAFFINSAIVEFDTEDPEVMQKAFPVCGPSRVAYSGSLAALAALRIRNGVASLLSGVARVPTTIATALGMIAAAPFAYLGALVERDRTLVNSVNPPKVPTSLTIEIDVG